MATERTTERRPMSPDAADLIVKLVELQGPGPLSCNPRDLAYFLLAYASGLFACPGRTTDEAIADLIGYAHGRAQESR